MMASNKRSTSPALDGDNILLLDEDFRPAVGSGSERRP